MQHDFRKEAQLRNISFHNVSLVKLALSISAHLKHSLLTAMLFIPSLVFFSSCQEAQKGHIAIYQIWDNWKILSWTYYLEIVEVKITLFALFL